MILTQIELPYNLETVKQKATEIANNSLDKIIYGVLSAQNNETVTITATDNEQMFVVGEDPFDIYARRIERRLQRQERREKHRRNKNQF
jgi:hypothetical protein